MLWVNCVPLFKRFYAFEEFRIPLVQDTLEDFDAREVDDFECGRRSAMTGENVRDGGFAIIWAVKIGRHTHDDDPARVKDTMDCASQ